MASHPNYVKQQLAVDTVSWTPVVAPIDCIGVGVKNSVSVDLRVRTDSANPATQDVIAAGSQDGITVSRRGDSPEDSGRGARFHAGETICYLQAVSGTGPAVITFVR